MALNHSSPHTPFTHGQILMLNDKSPRLEPYCRSIGNRHPLSELIWDATQEAFLHSLLAGYSIYVNKLATSVADQDTGWGETSLSGGNPKEEQNINKHRLSLCRMDNPYFYIFASCYVILLHCFRKCKVNRHTSHSAVILCMSFAYKMMTFCLKSNGRSCVCTSVKRKNSWQTSSRYCCIASSVWIHPTLSFMS